MAIISVTNTFVNGTIIEAGEVNQNFTDIINGTSDGTKDIIIANLTANTTSLLNGTTIGATGITLAGGRDLIGSATSDIVFDTDKLVWDSANSLLALGTASPSSYNTNARQFVIASTVSTGLTIKAGAANNANIAFTGVENTTIEGLIGYSIPNESMTFRTNGTDDRILIDSNGLIGMNQGSPSSFNALANNLVITDTGDCGITIHTGTNDNGGIIFTNAVGTSTPCTMVYDHGLNELVFRVNSVSDVFKIDGSSNAFFTGTVDASSFSTGNETFTYNEGTTSITTTGLSVEDSGTARWVRVGEMVTLYLPTLTGESDATTFSAATLPAEIRPTRNQIVAATNGENFNTKLSVYQIRVETSGTISFAFLTGGSYNYNGWTNSGTKGIETTVINYSLT